MQPDAPRWDKGSVEEFKRWLAESEPEEESPDDFDSKLDFPWPINVKEQRTIWGSAKDATIQSTLSFDEIAGAEDYEIRLALLEQTPAADNTSGGDGTNPGSGSGDPGNPGGGDPGGIDPLIIFFQDLFVYPNGSYLVDVGPWTYVPFYTWNPSWPYPTLGGAPFDSHSVYITNPAPLGPNEGTALGTGGHDDTNTLPFHPGFFLAGSSAPDANMTITVNLAQIAAYGGTYYYKASIMLARNSSTGEMLVVDFSKGTANVADGSIDISLYHYSSGTATLLQTVNVENSPFTQSVVTYSASDGTSVIFNGNQIITDSSTFGGLSGGFGWTAGHWDANVPGGFADFTVSGVNRPATPPTPPSTGDPDGGGTSPYVPSGGSYTNKVFAHYFPPYPLSLDNKNPASDYYVNGYLNPTGESGKHKAYGGLLRDRPIGVTPDSSSSTYPLRNAKMEVAQAKGAGLDGFVCDILSLSTGTGNNKKFQDAIFQAAEDDGAFYCLPMIDCSGLQGKSDAQLAQTIDYYLDYGCNLTVGGDLVVTTFLAEAISPSRWSNIESILSGTYSRSVKWVFIFNTYSYITGGTYDSLAYGYGMWGNRNPAGNSTATGPGTPKQRILDAQAGGFIWMQPVSVQDERPNQHIYDEAENTQNLRNTWDIAIAGGADWVQIPTWNDYSEGAHINPSMNRGWGYLDLCSYYAEWYHTGSAPTITQDAIYLTHRIQMYSASPSYPESSLMTLRPGSSSARNKVEALVFLKSAATVTINSGGTISTFSGSAGINSFLADLHYGTISATVTRAGVTTASVTSPYKVVSTPYVQDLQYYAAASLRSGYASGGTGNGIPMPTTDPSGWTRIYEEDFNTNVVLGGFSAATGNTLTGGNPYASKLKMYPTGWADNSRNGEYSPERTVSAKNSILDVYLHTESGKHYGAAIQPILPTFKYGRIDVCMRINSITNYRVDNVLYPASGNYPGDGKIDWPLSDSAGANLSGHAHYANPAGGEDVRTSTANPATWHVYGIEWEAGTVKFFLDGAQVGATSTTDVPSTALNYIMQFETSATAPGTSSAGHIQIDWIVAYV